MNNLRDQVAVSLGNLALRIATPWYRNALREVIVRGFADMDRQMVEQAERAPEEPAR